MPERQRLVLKQTIAREKVLTSPEAVELAREALSELTRPENVGEHLGMVQEGDRVLTHAFDCLLPGYRGWAWVVTLARASRSKKVTIDEMALRPGTDALLAPEWIPWAERLQPSDVSPTDRLPYQADDPRLEGGFESTGEDADQLADFELGLGRRRVLSAEGRDDAYARWYGGNHGPKTAGSRAARAHCSTCGFFIPMAGSARRLFGVCANEWSPDDGTVVSLDHGCGAHSETDTPKSRKMWDPSDPVVDENDLDVVIEDDGVREDAVGDDARGDSRAEASGKDGAQGGSPAESAAGGSKPESEQGEKN